MRKLKKSLKLFLKIVNGLYNVLYIFFNSLDIYQISCYFDVIPITPPGTDIQRHLFVPLVFMPYYFYCTCIQIV